MENNRANRVPSRDSVLFVSSAMLAPKKRDHMLARRQRYLNYGALSLATLLRSNGREARVFHGGHEVSGLSSKGSSQAGSRHPGPIMLSVLSFHGLDWARSFARALKIRDSAARLIVGGRWVVGGDPSRLAGKIPEADVVVPGLAEDLVARIADPDASFERFLDGGAARDGAGRPPSHLLNHHLVEDFASFQPSIEVSRGCGMRCAFCEERDIPLSGLTDQQMLADHLAKTVQQYGGGTIHPYLQSSYFLPNRRWARELAEATRKHGLAIAWMTEPRVDSILLETIEHLAAAGMKIVDLGLESALPRQLLRMRKSQTPNKYLQAAARTLQACRDNGVWAKVNILLYAGETKETLAETRDWLEAHADCIKRVSVGPVIAYGPRGSRRR